MATRSTRNQPFCWQEKKILRLLRERFDKTELCKYRNLYLTLTEIDSDFNGQPIQFYTKTIMKYSGLSKDWIPSALLVLVEIGIIQITEHLKAGNKFAGRELKFTPENIIETPLKSVTRKPVNGQSVTGDTPHKKIVSLEDSSLKEEQEPVKSQKQISRQSFSKNSLEMKMTTFAIKQIQSTHPHLVFTAVAKQKHCIAFRDLMAIDKKTTSDIRAVLTWLPTAARDKNGFSWADQLKSPSALRRKNQDGITKFNMLFSAMQAEQNGATRKRNIKEIMAKQETGELPK